MLRIFPSHPKFDRGAGTLGHIKTIEGLFLEVKAVKLILGPEMHFQRNEKGVKKNYLELYIIVSFTFSRQFSLFNVCMVLY